MKISGAIFDMDGTLLDSMYVWDDIGEKYLLSCGITPRASVAADIKDMSTSEAAEYFRKSYGLNKTNYEMGLGISALVEEKYRSEVLPKNGVIPLLQRLRAAGVKMCVATATEMPIVEMVLEKNDMLQYFDEILTCTTAGAGKNQPMIYEKALELLGTKKSETPVFEDALYAVRTAKQAGFPLVGVYDPSSEHNRPEIIRLSDVYLQSFTDCGRLFE
ncbi:MAG: HAD family phosphatase [Oscillospiraceae bacterium]